MAFGRAVRFSLFIESGFCLLFQELPAGRFEKATKTRFQFHKAITTIPNAVCAIIEYLILRIIFFKLLTINGFIQIKLFDSSALPTIFLKIQSHFLRFVCDLYLR